MSPKRRITVGDLKDGQAYGMLLCPKCGSEFSADRGDYWHMPLHHVMKCCNVNSRLVRKETRYVNV